MSEDPQELEYDLQRIHELIREAHAVMNEGEEPGEELYGLMGSYDDIEETCEVLISNREDIKHRLEAARQGKERPQYPY